MPSGSFFALFDDIATLLDDVAAMTKVAAKKTSGILGDDLALNAQQVTGVAADRELPVVWAVAKGSLVNKVILVPAALALSALASWSVKPLLMAGGAFLCFEGAEKILHKLFHKEEEAAHHADLAAALANPATDVMALEREKVRGAIRTDFILSAEIVAITLAAAEERQVSLGVKAGAMAGVSLLMTVGVYGLVAGIVKLDDAGVRLASAQGAGAGFRRALGRGILRGAPWLMKALSIGGTAAMFLVGGGILVHGIPALEHAVEDWAKGAPGSVAWAVPGAVGGLAGVVAGVILVGIVSAVKRAVPRKPAAGV
ncbi:MAG: Inner membrane protein YedI [Planctomycetes bacterium]|nr:Inner membrane protein YedI [Planctomycetota bacterium]